MDRQKEILSLIKSMFPKDKQETLPEQILVLIYELGDLTKAVSRMIWYPKDNVMYKAYRAEAKRALGDMVTQIYLTCEYLELDFNEVKEFGYLALKEKVEEWKKKGLKKC